MRLFANPTVSLLTAVASVQSAVNAKMRWPRSLCNDIPYHHTGAVWWCRMHGWDHHDALNRMKILLKTLSRFIPVSWFVHNLRHRCISPRKCSCLSCSITLSQSHGCQADSPRCSKILPTMCSDSCGLASHSISWLSFCAIYQDHTGKLPVFLIIVIAVHRDFSLHLYHIQQTAVGSRPTHPAILRHNKPKSL